MTALDFSRRANLVERMDPPDGPVAALEATLRRFELTNRLLTRYRYLLQRYILDDMRRDPLREYRLTDLGAGGGDIARWLIRRARRDGLRLRVCAIEKDVRAADYARRAAADYPELIVVTADALDPACWQDPDYAYAQHLLHHLPDDAGRALIHRLSRGVRRRFLVNDLVRSRLAYRVFSVLALPLSRGTYIREDGLISIRRSYRLDEVRQLLKAAAPAGQVTAFPLFPNRCVILGGPV